jgi:hypothetical protein
VNIEDLPRMGQDIKSAELRENNVYITTARGDVYRVWIHWDGKPLMEILKQS